MAARTTPVLVVPRNGCERSGLRVDPWHRSARRGARLRSDPASGPTQPAPFLFGGCGGVGFWALDPSDAPRLGVIGPAGRHLGSLLSPQRRNAPRRCVRKEGRLPPPACRDRRRRRGAPARWDSISTADRAPTGPGSSATPTACGDHADTVCGGHGAKCTSAGGFAPWPGPSAVYERQRRRTNSWCRPTTRPPPTPRSP